MAAVDWSKLPKDLLNLIPQRIYDEVDLIRFRSICSTWRSSSLTPMTLIPSTATTTLHSVASPNKISWLIRVGQSTHGRTQYLHPIIRNCSFVFRSVLDYNKLSVTHLGSTFFIMDFDFKHNRQLFNRHDYMYPKKVVAVTCHGKKPLVVGTLAPPPHPLLLKCGDENWKVIPDNMSMKFGDICVFKGRPYAVDKIGKMIMIGSYSSVQLVAEPLVGDGKRKFLVESEGDLLLADVYDCLCIDLNDPVMIDLFKLNEKEKKRVKLTSLGDKVLFLGLGLVCSFSVSASDLCVSKGNCVVFVDDIFESIASKCELYVLDLDQGQLSFLYDHPEYSNLFWLPQTWIRARYQTTCSAPSS